jgi:serine/threonine protein kinase
MAPSVESLCNDLARCRLLRADEVRALRSRWLAEAGDRGADLGAFTRWLVACRYVTDYQLGFIDRGHGNSLVLDQYLILERVGKGRMAGVYKAVHRLGPTVAIKILPPSKARDPQILARFQRETRLAMAMEHPNVVRAYQVGQEGDLHYLVMEYLEGETLADVLRRRGQLPSAEAVRLVYQALLGLQHIHERGLIHRDLKPGNLMLVPGPREVPGAAEPDSTSRRLVKIVDIGTGRDLFADDVDGKGNPFQLTNDEDLLGTPDYMAPEQARDPHGADIRADIYSLGCVLYHALAGQPPFPDQNLVRKMMRHATEAPPPLRTFSSAAPDGLQQVVTRLLAKDPAQRFPAPAHAAQALQAFLADGPETFDLLPAEKPMRDYLQWLEQGADSAATVPDPSRTADPAPVGGPLITQAAAASPDRRDRDRAPGKRARVPVARGISGGNAASAPIQGEPLPGATVDLAPPPRGWGETWTIVALAAATLVVLVLCGGAVGLIVYFAAR